MKHHIAALLLLTTAASAHDHWIYERLNLQTHVRCCTPKKDCYQIPASTIVRSTAGFTVAGGEFVPNDEAQVSEDGNFWMCRRWDGTRNCFFYPPENV